jgi:hypothetical protein
MDFSVGGLAGALVANIFAAFKGNESKKLMDSDPALKTRIGGTGNQFAIMTMLVFFVIINIIIPIHVNDPNSSPNPNPNSVSNPKPRCDFQREH